MCHPGVKSSKTDDELASSLRNHIRAATIARAELCRRGWAVTGRGHSGYAHGWNDTIEIKKTVTTEVNI